MNAEGILSRLRRFLLGLSAFLMAGTLVELAAINHTKEPVQWVPFALCGLGLAAVAGASFWPQRKMLQALRALMSVVALGSLLGVYEHVMGNLAFQQEVHPNSTTAQLIRAAVGGASPLLAPGMLALAGALAIAATYYHPGLRPEAAASPDRRRYASRGEREA